MIVDYTGRQFTIPAGLKKEVEAGLSKLSKLLGNTSKAKVILTASKQRRIAEITVTRRDKLIVGLGEAADASTAVGEALDHIEKQLLKLNGRKRDSKRTSKPDWKLDAPETELPMAVGAAPNAAVPVVVHRFPRENKVTEAHLVRGDDCVALRPLTIEEAIKECEFRDRGILVFRDRKNEVKVLHRRQDGKLELIEAP